MTKKASEKLDNLELIKVKHMGRIYTPDYLVDIILDSGHYIKGNINKKHVIENSCGNGQFVIHIIDRYCKDYLSNNSDLINLKKELETYIHAIEVDSAELNVCIERSNELVKKFGIQNVNWDFICGDALSITKFDNKMDFVVGNPPYVRVHNLDENVTSVKNYIFGNGGMTDMYIVFYEVGLKMLNDKGILTYITPSSFFTSIAGKNMRNYLSNNHLLESVCDLKHFQAFDATTYTAIICLNKNINNDKVSYYEFDDKALKPQFVEDLNVEEYTINGKFYFASKTNLSILRKILTNLRHSDIEVKNGYATLCDRVFIKDFEFESKYIIPVIKGSRAKWTKIFYPYDKNGNLIAEDVLARDENIYSYLLQNKKALLNRSNEKGQNSTWYAFGRSQGIKDTYNNKISLNTLIKDAGNLKVESVPSGSGVYSGLYLMSQTISSEKIKKELVCDEFVLFVSLLGKYKAGGCYTFSSKDVKCYLDYKLGIGGFVDYDD